MSKLADYMIILMTYAVVVFLAFIAGAQSAQAGGYHVTKNYYTNITNNYSGVSDKDLATISAMTGAAGAHHFSKSIQSWQGSVAGACHDSSADDCGISFALGKRSQSGDYLWSISASGASNERLYAGSIGWTW